MVKSVWILRIALLVGVICAVTSSPEAEHDDDMVHNLSEAKEEVQEIEDDVKDVKATPAARQDMWVNFENLINAYNKENERLLHWNHKMARDLDDSRMGIKFGVPITYENVPNFVLRNDATPLAKPTTGPGCEVMCNSRPACNSYSFNKHTMVCLLSTTKLNYSPTTRMYLKKELGEGDPAHSYQVIPGLAGDSIPVPGATSAKKPFSECKWECTKAKKDCTGFVYDEAKQLCVTTGGESGWDPNWSYHEKIRHDPDKKELKLQGSEHRFKEQIRVAWKGQNKEAAVREAIAYKEVQHKCKFTKGAAAAYEKQAEHYHGLVRTHKAVLETLRVQAWKTKDALNKAETHLRRAKTTRLDATAENELLSKQGEKVIDPKEIKPIYDNIAIHQARLADANNKIRDFTAEAKALQKKATRLHLDRKKKQSILEKDTDEREINKAKAVMTHAQFKEKCGESDRVVLKAQMKEEKQAAKIDADIARQAEKAAAEKKKAAENANKAAEEAKGTNESMELEREAEKAGREADLAEADAKTKTQNELKVMTAKDKMLMKLAKQQAAKKKWQDKVAAAVKFLKVVEARRDAEADAEFERKMSEPTLS